MRRRRRIRRTGGEMVTDGGQKVARSRISPR